MNLLKKAYYTACSFLPPAIVKRLSPVKTLLPYHHVVSDKELLHIKNLYSYKNIKQFRDDLEFLIKHFTAVSVEDLVESMEKGRPLKEGSFLLTFDDGFKEVHEVIAPILHEKKIPAIFFINPAFIDNKELFYRCKISLMIEELSKRKDALEIAGEIMDRPYGDFHDLKTDLKKINQLNKDKLDDLAETIGYSFYDYLRSEKPFMTSEQVQELSDQGFMIGSHSWDHPYYEYLSADEQLNQTIRSIEFVKDRLHNKYSCFSFPHTDAVVTQEFFDKLKLQPVKADLMFGIQNQKSEAGNKMLHRFNAERPEVNIKSQVNGILLYTLMQSALGRNKIERI
jgi:peptidoglycan/xylan/chitin deacetylase (PgdA/CDA1 family)